MFCGQLNQWLKLILVVCNRLGVRSDSSFPAKIGLVVKPVFTRNGRLRPWSILFVLKHLCLMNPFRLPFIDPDKCIGIGLQRHALFSACKRELFFVNLFLYNVEELLCIDFENELVLIVQFFPKEAFLKEIEVQILVHLCWLRMIGDCADILT